MNINIIRKIIAVFTAITIISVFTACRKDDGLGHVFKYDISANPATLDPQQASEPNSNTIIANMFTGLVEIAQDGSVQNGAAESYSVSKDGLAYEFKLRRDIYWIDGEGFEKQCTANDFVFGFWRLFLPETEAPHAKDYFCIKNARAVNEGGVTDRGKLGVKAKSDFELEITLEYPNPRFLSMLAEPPAMPCCEEYFKNAQGRYGLSAECTPSNGAFYLKSWTYDPYSITDTNNLILGKNAKNAESRTVCPSGLNFFIEDEDDHIPDFKNGEVSCIAVSNNEKPLIKGSYSVYEFSNVTCGLVFNSNFALFKNENFKKSLCMLTDRGAIMEALSEYEKADGVVPKQVSIDGKGYRETNGAANIPEYNVKAATDLFSSISSQLDKSLLTGAKMIVPDTAAQTAVSYAMQEWQRELGFYCTVKVLSENEYAKALREGDFDIAVLELSGKYNSPSAYLEQFTKSSGENYTRFYNAEFEEYLNKAEAAASSEESAAFYLKAEQILIDRCAFYPLYYKNEYFFTSKKGEDIIYNPFSKTVNFALAKLRK